MAVPINAIMEGKIHYFANGQECMNVLHFAPNVGGIGTELDITGSFLDEFKSNAVGTLIDAMTQCMSNQVEIHKCTAQLIFPTRFIIRSAETNYFGTVNSPCDAQNTTATFTKRGQAANKHNIGSFHLGGLPISMLQQGLLAEILFGPKLAALKTALLNVVNDVVAGIVWTPAILNKTKTIVDGKPHYTVTGRTIVFETERHNQVRTMHRRTVGLGI